MALNPLSANRSYPVPSTANKHNEDWPRQIIAIEMIDADMQAVLDALAQRSPVGHVHAIGDVTGLQAALDGKQSSAWRPPLGDLTNVDTTGAANGQFLGLVAGTWAPVTLAIVNVQGLQAALNGKSDTGHGHVIGDVTGLQFALDGKLDAPGGALGVGDGGTGANSKSGAAASLEVVSFGADQALDVADRVRARANIGATTVGAAIFTAADAAAARTAIGATTVGAAVFTAANEAAGRTALGLGSVATENTVPVAKGGTGASSTSVACANLGAVAFAHTQSLTASEQAQARVNIGATTVGTAVFTAADAAAARTAIGATAVLVDAGQPGNAGILMQNQSSGTVTVNGDVAGSLLRYAVFTSTGSLTTGAAVPSGTWRNVSELEIGVNEFGTFRRRT